MGGITPIIQIRKSKIFDFENFRISNFEFAKLFCIVSYQAVKLLVLRKISHASNQHAAGSFKYIQQLYVYNIYNALIFGAAIVYFFIYKYFFTVLYTYT